MGSILKVENLGISFSQYTKGLKRQELRVITNLDVELHEGEILAVVGSSGSGKSLLAHAILGILPTNAKTEGAIYYQGKELTQKDKEEIRGKELSLVPQSVNFLDPLQKVGDQIRISMSGKSRKEQDAVVRDLLRRYGLSEGVADDYPHQLSGGMARKVLLDTALAADSRVIIADEPTPGLDEASLNEVLRDFRGAADSGRSILMITHDINAAFRIADRIAIFYAGSTLEIADVKDFAGMGEALRHPYSKALLHALPDRGFTPIPGAQPLPGELPDGCLFAGRCNLRRENCETIRPGLRDLRGGKVRCAYAT